MSFATDAPQAAACAAFGLEWPYPFFSYQVDGIERLVNRPAVLLADEMGLGKTIQAIAALRVLTYRTAVRVALIVCPAGLVLQWRRQLQLWAPELPISTAIGPAHERRAAWRRDAVVFLTNYECLRNDMGVRGSAGPAERRWDVVAIDEAQRIKNPNADAAIATKRLHRTRSWALTGTPLENRLDDLVSILGFVAPGRFDRADMAVGLRRLLGEVQLRRRRCEVLPDLPPKFAATLTLDLAPQQRRAYLRAEEEGVVWLRALGTRLRISHVLELILRLKQICNFCPESGQSAKFADLRARLAMLTDQGEKVLVFTQFVGEPFGARRLARELADFRPLLLIGAQDARERAAAVATLERDPSRRLMILSLRAGGLGLNLTAASCVFHYDRWWNPAVEVQAEDRTHRIGQERPVQVFAYLCADTIEERVAAILAEKRALFADFIDGVPLPALARLDLDSLVQAAAPGFHR